MSTDDLRDMRKEITALIDDIKYQSDSLTDLQRLPIIQLKVILTKMNKLTEKTVILMHYVEKMSTTDEVVISEPTKEKEETEEPEREQIAAKRHEEDQKEVQETQAEPEVEQLQEERPENLDLEAPMEEPATLENIEERLNKLVVNDLNSAIGINEKYLYASEMFNGNVELFIQTIQLLNNMQSMIEAKSKLDELSSEFNWDSENAHVQSFIDLIERKFSQS